MMNVKRSTQSFSKAEQAPPVFPGRTGGSGGSVSATEQGSNVSAGAMQAAYGDAPIGDVLNKIADPNYIEPGKKMRAAGNPQLDKDAFMKLMLTQMKYQDPTKPMESHEMAAQLAQFTSLEQLNNIHTTLESMKTQAQPGANYQALALIGKRVSGDSSKLTRAAGDTKHGISFELLGDTAKVRVTIKDANGNLVRAMDVPNLKKGRNTVEWNGLAETGQAARPGDYKITVEGVSNTGKKVFAKTSFGGRITGLNYTNEGPVLLVGNQSIKLSDVKKIEDAGPEETGAAPAVPLGTAAAAAGAAGAAAPASTEGMGKMIPLPPQLTAQAAPQPAGPMMPLGAGPEHATVTKPETREMKGKVANEMMKKTAAMQAPSEPAKAEVTASDGNVPPAEDAPEMPHNIEDVPMAQGLINQLAKAK